jgi:putative ATP-dependent endonuclease of OLD family
MKIESVQIRNFRMLKETDINFEDVLSLVIGKNNSGKTSFLSILQKFLSESKPEFAFEDFSIEAQQAILALEDSTKTPEDYSELALSLKLNIVYKETDNLAEASALLLDLDSMKKHLIVLFEYVLTYEKYQKLMTDFTKYKAKGIKRDFSYYISNNINQFFSVRIKALEYGNEVNFKIISNDIVKTIISLQTIVAKRDVDNEQGHSNSLSILAGKYYNASVLSEEEFPELQKQLQDTDESLSGIYRRLFEPIVKEIAEMSYNPHEAELSILSTLSEKKIFQDNTTVKYKHEGTLLPEDYNGLGYLNLFAIIFNLRIKLDKLSKKNKPDERPTPLNLLFIEEPEAHTHPQMQYIFIRNIKRILKQHRIAAGKDFSLQTIISTHSSHIVSQCDFQDIKYFYRESAVSVKSRNLKELYSKMVTAQDNPTKAEQERFYRFVKQYVTLNRAELFFANKAILIEGDTERMLLSAMMKKIDDEMAAKEDYEPLLSQNISVIEVGAYSHIFAVFLGFLGIKTLIITDLDCAMIGNKGKARKCRFTEGTTTTNASIKFFTKSDDLNAIVNLSTKPITFSYKDDASKWDATSDGQLRLVFQKEENGYQARSFEDAFISNNLRFIVDNEDNFTSLKNKSVLKATLPDYYDIADQCIESKTSFALDILLYGGENNEGWTIPLYIREGLEWLAQ